MRSTRLILRLSLTLLVALSISGSLLEARGQKRGKSAPPETPDTPPEPTGPKRGKSALEIKVVTKTEIVRVQVKPNKGYLSLVAVPGAQVTLTPISAAKQQGKARPTRKAIKEEIKDEDGTLNLVDMPPGNYKVAVEHSDFLPYSGVIAVAPARLTTLNARARLTSKYGNIMIGGVPQGTRVLLDDQEPDSSLVTTDEQGGILISRIPVGEHKLKISKERYDDWGNQLKVKPGETIPVTAYLRPAVISLAVKSKPNARVYLNDEERGTVQPDGRAAISNLLPGTYKLRVSLEGFEDAERQLELTLNNRQPVETAELMPIAESGEAAENFVTGLKKWAPAPPNWKLETGGIRVSGDQVALFKDATERRQFNVYRDFTLDLDLRFSNGKGAAWIIRAKDLKNYYLFELATSKSGSQRKVFNFYICRDSKLELVDSRPVVENIEKPNDSFHITIEARGNQFRHTIKLRSAPKPDAEPLGTFTDDTFSYGGIGFRAISGVEMLVQSLVIIPEKKR